MNARTTGFCLKQGLINIKRNKLFSLASIGTIAACVFLISVILAIIINVNYMETYVEQKVGINIFFEKGISQENIQSIGEVLKSNGKVKEFTYTSAEQAWENFKQDYFGEHPELAEGFKDDNPLADSASYKVFLNNIEDQQSFVEEMQKVEGVREVQYSSTTQNALSNIGKLLGYASAALIVILFLISNMVMIGISVRKQEIKIMKLIGATNRFVRAPFILEGVVIGVIGSVLPLILMRVAYSRVVEAIMNRFGVLGNNIPFARAHEVFAILIPLGLGIGVGIGLIGSAISIRKHLKV